MHFGGSFTLAPANWIKSVFGSKDRSPVSSTAARDFAAMTIVHRHQAGLNLLQGKWLDQIIVGAAIEPLKFIVQRVSRRDYQYRGVNIRFLAKLPTQ